MWVFHNAHFDLSILRGALQRLSPDLLPQFFSHHCLCTMLALVGDLDHGDHYKSLPRLTQFFYGISPSNLILPSIPSWRNVCLTRACLKQILDVYHSYLESDGERTASYYLSLELKP